jgi:SAM-dependent methyltransferase
MSYANDREVCPICGSHNLQFIFEQNFSPMSNSGIMFKYDVTVCLDCSMAFANNIPSQKAFDDYYFTSNKYQSELPKSMPDAEWDGKILEYILANFSDDITIADIGCGTGNILTSLANDGFSHLIGLDTSGANCQNLSNVGIRVINKSLFDVNSDDLSATADLMLCICVLEHIVDLRPFIDKMLSFLGKDGTIIICVPEINIRNAVKFPFQEFSTEHINYFTYSSLCNLFSKYNLYPVDRISADGTMTVVFSRRRNDIKSVLLDYVENSKIAIKYACRNVSSLLLTKQPVTVWGVGTLTRYLLANTDFADMNIIAFTDGNPNYHGKLLSGKTVVPPTEIDKESTIVISTYNADSAIEKMIRCELQMNNKIVHVLSQN